MQPIPCPICSSSENTLVCARTRGTREYRVVRCDTCGFHHVNPEPAESELLAFYDAEYSSGHDPVWHGFEDALNRRVISDLAGFGVRSLVDLGAGQGRFVHLARQAGLAAEGVEPSAVNCAAALDRYAIHLQPLTVGDFLASTDGGLECITMLNVLEHLAAPIDVLRQVRGALRPGGRLAVIVPNVDFTLTLGRVRSAAGFRDVYMLESGRFSQQGFDPPIHLSSFNAAHLRTALTRAGFRIDSIGQSPVIRTRSRAVHMAKLAVAAAGHVIDRVTRGRVVWGYSLYGLATRD